MAVLQGDAGSTGGKRVLKSNENSKVFFYYSDHGAPGVVGMPTGEYFYADELHQAIKFMNKNNMYKEMTIYMESCESGSMFENILEKNLNVYAVSAANSHESSWGNYCAPNDTVDGKSIGSCLGDLFSTNWMEDTEANDISKETLQS
jgi:legumain